MKIKKILSALLSAVMLFCLIPSSAFAEELDDKTVTLIYGESAKAANLTICDYMGFDPVYMEQEGMTPNVYTEDIVLYPTTDSSLSTRVLTINKDAFDIEHFDFVGWKVTKDGDDSTSLYVTMNFYYLGKGSEGTHPYIRLTDEAAEHIEKTFSGVFFERGYKPKYFGNYTIEPIFEKKSTSSYTFSLSLDGNDRVEAGEDVKLDLYVDGGAYNAFSSTIGYDSELFDYVSCSDEIDVDSSEAGKLKISAVGIEKKDGEMAAELRFMGKAVSEEKTGEFSLLTAKAGTSAEAVSSDAAEAKKGDPVSVTVNKTDVVVVTYPDGSKDQVAKGSDLTFRLSEKYPEYAASGYTYKVKAGEFTVKDNADGTYTIKAITNDVTVEVEKLAEGNLETYNFKVGAKLYRVAKYAGIAESGKTFFYDGKQMIRAGSEYLYIIGESGEADLSKIKEEDITQGEAITMSVSGDVNQTGVIDINDAQLVSDLYNGKYKDGFDTVAMVKYLAADVNGDRTVSSADIAAVVGNQKFVY